jgi:hypothetical protein
MSELKVENLIPLTEVGPLSAHAYSHLFLHSINPENPLTHSVTKSGERRADVNRLHGAGRQPVNVTSYGRPVRLLQRAEQLEQLSREFRLSKRVGIAFRVRSTRTKT